MTCCMSSGDFGIGRDDFVHARIFGQGDVVVHLVRRIAQIVRRQVVEEFFGELDGVVVILGDEVDVAADLGVGVGAGELVERGGLAGGRADDVRAADEHVGVLARHDDEVGEGGRVGRTAGAGAGDDGDLRDHAGGEHVAEEDLAVAGKRFDAFLDAGAAGVVDADDGDAGLDGEVEQVADFLGVDGADGAAADGEILGEGGDLAAIDRAGGADDAVTGHLAFFEAEVDAGMVGVHSELDEVAAVEERGESFAGAEQAFFVAFFDAVDAASDEGFFAAELEPLHE